MYRLFLNIFFFNDTATTEIYTLSLHDALPISGHDLRPGALQRGLARPGVDRARRVLRSEEHTSELQSHSDLVCRLLLEKKKQLSFFTPPSEINEDNNWFEDTKDIMEFLVDEIG